MYQDMQLTQEIPSIGYDMEELKHVPLGEIVVKYKKQSTVSATNVIVWGIMFTWIIACFITLCYLVAKHII